MSHDDNVSRRQTTREGNAKYSRFVPPGIRAAFVWAVLAAPLAHGASVPLHFDTFTPETNIANANNELGPAYTEGLTMDFLNVATYEGTTIDARVTAVVKPDTEFATGTTNRTACGFIPNYKAHGTRAGQPTGDLGLLYAGMDEGVSGVTLTISFFNGTGDRRGTFRDAFAIPDLHLLVYDVDGESAQAEWFEVAKADGLYSYATGDTPASVTATTTATGVHFAGPGKDFRETDTSGAVLLQYRNTSRVTLAFGSEQFRTGRNLVFAAIDGDLNLPVTGEFQAPKVVPAPAIAAPAPSNKTVSRLFPADNGLLVERVTPAEVPLNAPFEYTLRVTNVTQTPVYEVVVRERLPKNFTLKNADPQPQKEDADLLWTLGALEPKASREFKISGIATTADKLEPCATVTFLVPPVCASIAVVEPKLTLTAVASKEVLVSEPIEVQFVVTNSGTGVAQGIKVVEVLPPGLRTADGKNELALDVGTLAAGQSRQMTGTLKAAKVGQYATKVIARGDGGLEAEAITATIVRQPVLALLKTGPARQYLGRPITYEMLVTNKGDTPAAQAVVEDTLPTGAQAVRTSPEGAVSSAKAVWQLGTLAAHEAKRVSITYVPADAGALAQAATASAVGAEPVTATAQTTIYGLAAVLLEVIDTEDPVPVGGQTTYVVTVTNQGSSPSTNVQIGVVVEEAEEIVAATGPTPVAVEGKSAKSAPLATLAPKAKATWKIAVKALKAGDVRFRTTLTTAQLSRGVEQAEATQIYE